MYEPCQVNDSGQIWHTPCGWTTDVQTSGNIVKCCKCGGMFEWRDGHYIVVAPTGPVASSLRVAGNVVMTVGKIVIGLGLLAFAMGAISQRDDCDCD